MVNQSVMTRPVTLITTVLNEERTICALLDSLLAQTRQPDEFIIVDAGSTDRTQSLVSDYIARGLKARLLVEPDASRAHGRNLAIAEATGEIIACIDAGCIAEPDWLEQLVEPFESDSPPDVVSGYYTPGGVTPFAQAVAVATVPTAEEVEPDKFLPSSRSVAFLKSRLAAGRRLSRARRIRGRHALRSQPEGRRLPLPVPARRPGALAHGLFACASVFRQFRNYALSDGELAHWFIHYQKAFLLAAAAPHGPAAHPHERLVGRLFPLLAGAYWLRYYLRARKRGAPKEVGPSPRRW